MIQVLNVQTTKSWLRWLLAFSCFCGTFTPISAQAAEAPYSEKVYLNESQALKKVFGSLSVSKQVIKPSTAQRKALQKKLRRKLTEPAYTFYVGKEQGSNTVTRYALILNEKGKHYPITFIVAMDPAAAVNQVAVMVYRERRGDGIKRRRFLKQFTGKTLKDPIEVNRDIVHITGSTISSWSIAAGVRKAVALLEALVV